MYGLRTVVHLFHGVRVSSVSMRYFVGVNCLPIKLLIVWVDRSLICVNVVGLWRACSSLCSSVCVLSSVMEIMSSVCVSAHVLLSSTASFLFAFYWLMRWAFLFLVEGEMCFFFWAWLVTCPVFEVIISESNLKYRIRCQVFDWIKTEMLIQKF